MTQTATAPMGEWPFLGASHLAGKGAFLNSGNKRSGCDYSKRHGVCRPMDQNSRRASII